MSKYGIIHNNHLLMYNPLNSRGEKMKKTSTMKIWVPWSNTTGSACVPFDTYEAAEEFAKEIFAEREDTFRIVELDEENQPVMTEELKKLKYGERPEGYER